MAALREIPLQDYALPAGLAGRLITPTLVIHLDRVRHNLSTVIDAVGGDPLRWRAHVKTVKIPTVMAEMLRAGLRGFKCATTREADSLARVIAAEGVVGADVLVAYPLIGPALRRADEIARARTDTRFSVLCEDPALVDSIPSRLDVFVDVNPGMQRTGVALDELDAIRLIARRAGSRFRGVHFYEGHLGIRDVAERRAKASACYDRLLGLLDVLRGDGLRIAELVTSGTPTFLEAVADQRLSRVPDTVHRVSPGTVVYHDARSEELDLPLALQPAALVLARVVSHPAGDRVTCDAGSKSVAAEAGDPCVIPLGWPGLEACTPSEEHLPLRVTSGTRPARGTELLLVPRHVCPTINLAEQAVLLDGGEFRELASVEARAHEIRCDRVLLG